MYVYGCFACMYVHAPWLCLYLWSQKKVLKPLGLELVVSFRVNAENQTRVL